MDHKLRLRQLKRLRSLETQLLSLAGEMRINKTFPLSLISGLNSSISCLRLDVAEVERDLAPYILKKGNKNG